MEACGFRDRAGQFARLDTVLVGVSTDTLADQAKFAAKEKLPYALLADTDKAVAKAFGVLMPANGFAKRATFVIDKEGVVRKVYPAPKPDTHPDEVLAYVKEHLAK